MFHFQCVLYSKSLTVTPAVKIMTPPLLMFSTATCCRYLNVKVLNMPSCTDSPALYEYNKNCMALVDKRTIKSPNSRNNSSSNSGSNRQHRQLVMDLEVYVIAFSNNRLLRPPPCLRRHVKYIQRTKKISVHLFNLKKKNIKENKCISIFFFFCLRFFASAA